MPTDWSGPRVYDLVAATPRPGDANGDGVFDSSDLTLVLQAGEFEDGTDGNSTFVEGDWNGDGDFTTDDLVLAFTVGGYVIGAGAQAAEHTMLDPLGVDAAFADMKSQRHEGTT